MLMESQFSGERRQLAAGRMKAQDTAQEEAHRWAARDALCPPHTVFITLVSCVEPVPVTLLA